MSQHSTKFLPAGLHQPKGALGQFTCCDSKLQHGTFSAAWLGCFFLEGHCEVNVTQSISIHPDPWKQGALGAGLGQGQSEHCKTPPFWTKLGQVHLFSGWVCVGCLWQPEPNTFALLTQCLCSAMCCDSLCWQRWSCACGSSLPGELPSQGWEQQGTVPTTEPFCCGAAPQLHGRDSAGLGGRKALMEDRTEWPGLGAALPTPRTHPPAPGSQSGCCFHSPGLAPPAGAH